MKGVDTIARVRRAYFVQGKSIKQIERELHVARNAVRKIIRSGETSFSYEREKQPLPRIGPWQAELDRLLLANEGKAARERLTLIRIYEELCGRGYEGSYDAVRRYGRRWSRERSQSAASAYVPLSFSAGEAYPCGENLARQSLCRARYPLMSEAFLGVPPLLRYYLVWALGPALALTCSIAYGAYEHLVLSRHIAAMSVPGDQPVAVVKLPGLHLSYPEAAVVDSNGNTIIANAMGGSVVLVEDGADQVILSNRRVETGTSSVFVDVRFAGSGELLAVDGSANQILVLDSAYELDRVIDGPDLGKGLHFISSVDERDGGLLIAARPSRRQGEAQYIPTGESALYAWRGSHWSVFVSASEAGDAEASFRDAIYLSDGRIAAVFGAELLVLSPAGEVVGRANIGGEHGGGILDMGGHFLVGSYTNIVRVDAVTLEVDPVVFPAPFANVGHLHITPDGASMLVTDTDRQVVYVQDRASGELVGQIGNQGVALKIVSLDARGDSLWMLENSSPRILEYWPETGDLWRVAGTGRQGYDAPKAATDFSFQYPSGMAVAPDGAAYVSEANYRIVQVDSGRVSIFAGDIHPGAPTDSQDRVATRFGGLRDMDVGPKGDLFVTDQGNHSVWKIDVDGAVSLVMGTGESGLWTPGELAVTQALNTPSGVLARADGSVLIADTYNNTVVEVTADGVVQPFAGVPMPVVYQGMGHYSGDGGLASAAELNSPRRAVEDAEGNVYIVDEFNNAIRKVTPEGIISTFAGGRFGYAEDGSAMNLPQDAAVLGNHLYVADTGNSIVWAFPLQ